MVSRHGAKALRWKAHRDYSSAQTGGKVPRTPSAIRATAAGHRVVHGWQHFEPEPVTPVLLAELRRITPNAPDHLPGQVALIEEFLRRHPRLPQVVCFDTAFHQTMPRVAKLLPIPRRFDGNGVQRFGFHGLSYIRT